MDRQLIAGGSLMEDRFFVVVDGPWLKGGGKNAKRLATHNLCPVGRAVGRLDSRCKLLVKYRQGPHAVATDEAAHLEESEADYYVKSDVLAKWLRSLDLAGRFVVYYFEGTQEDARCV